MEQAQTGLGDFKLVFCIVHEDDANPLRTALSQNEFESTVMSSTGGFLRKGNVTLLIGVEGARLEKALSIIRQVSHPHEEPLPPPQRGATKMGAATVFVLDVEDYRRV